MKRSDEWVRRVQARLEARHARRGHAAEPALVICPAGTLPDEYAAQLRAEGRQAPMLCVPAIPEGPDAIEQWAAGAARYQAWLLKQGAAIAGGAEQTPGDKVRQAYKAALADEPMPD